MSRERLPWFKCYPSKLLTAIAGLEPDESLLYITVLLRIYESGGPVKDTLKVLCRRTGLPEKRGAVAFESLCESGKIRLLETGEIDSETTHQHLEERADLINSAKKAGKTSAEKRTEKSKQYQENDATGVAIVVNGASTTKTKTKIETESKEEKESPNGDSQKPGLQLLSVDPEPKQKPAKKQRSRTRIDAEAQPNEKDRQEATGAGMSADEFRFEWRRFRDHHLKEGSLMADWPAAWRYWISNWIKFSAKGRPGSGGSFRSSSRDGCGELLDEIAQERARRNGQSPDDGVQQPPKPSKFAREFDVAETLELS